jgi:hypothetical protein
VPHSGQPKQCIEIHSRLQLIGYGYDRSDDSGQTGNEIELFRALTSALLIEALTVLAQCALGHVGARDGVGQLSGREELGPGS